MTHRILPPPPTNLSFDALAPRPRAYRRFRRLLPALALTFLALAAIAASGLLAPLTAEAAAPGTPSSVTLARADGTVTATWPAVDGATKYHVTYTTDNGGSWHAPVADHTNVPTNTLTFDADNAKTYVVGVRAGNDHGWGGWRNSAAAGPYTPPPPPATPSSVSVTRSDGALTASWDAPAHAAAYHVTYTVNGSGNWLLASLDHASTSIEIGGVDNAKTYVVGVRARNSGGAWSGWRNSPAAGPFVPPPPTPTPVPAPERPTGLTATAGNGSVTLAWDDPANATITGYEYQWRAAPPAPGWGAWTAVAESGADTTSFTVDGLTNGTEYRFKLRAVNTTGAGKPSGPPWYVAATPTLPPPPAAPTGLSVTPGEGSLDIEWDAVSEATGYDVRAKTSGSSDWHDVASNVTGTSYTYTTSQTIDAIGVRARNAGGASAWAEISRGPSENWLRTVIQGGASAQSVQGQNQLAAPASVTVTRDNSLYDEKLYVTWDAVTGAGGYNLACAAEPAATPLSGWSWWHCGSVDSGSTTTFTVDDDKRGDRTRDLGWARAYAVAVRAVTTSPAQAGPWLVSADAYPAYEPDDITASRADGSVSLSWTANHHLLPHAEGYEIECATRAGNVSAAYTRCADVEDATPVSGKLSATISSWTAGGTDYTIDDSKTYDLRVRTTNAWGESSWRFAPLIYPPPELTVSNVGVQTATLTIANHSNAWYYKANAAPDNTCKGPVNAGTSTKDLTGLSANTGYDYAAYSDSACTTANELATAARFTTLSSVSNLGSTKQSGSGKIHTSLTQAVAFSISSTAGSSNYILKSVTLPLRYDGGSHGVLGVRLREMDGAGTYSATSQAAREAVSNATFTGTAPTSSSFTDTTFTCSGSGCELDRGKTYFVVLSSGATHPGYGWAYATTETEVALPSDNGWSVGFGHYDSGPDGTWASYSDWSIAEFVFAHAPTLTASAVTATGATLTIANHGGDWYYKANAAPDNTCKGPVSGNSKTVSGLTAGTSYTYTAYSDSTCTTANEIAAAAAFTPPSLTASAITTTGATLTVVGAPSTWYVQRAAPTTGVCTEKTTTTHDPGTLTAGTTYTFNAYSASGCASANLLASETFTTLASVSNLGSTRSGDANISSTFTSQAVAFTTGSGNSGGYVLENVTIPLKKTGGTGGLTVTLHEKHGTSPQYSATSRPASTEAATLSGTAPTSSSYVNTTYTCSGDGCKLDPGTTYFIVASRSGSANYAWNYASTESETDLPSDNGFDIRYGHDEYLNTWSSVSAYNVVEIVFAYGPSLTSSSVTASGATLAISYYPTGDWYYKADAAPHTSCQGPVSGTSTTLSGLSGGTTYTYTAYSDSTCTTANSLATAAAFTTTPNAPSGLSLSYSSGTNTMHGYWNKPSGMTGSVTYEIQSVNTNRNNPYGGTTTISSSAARVDHNFGTSLTVKFRVRTKVGSVTSAWAEYTS